MSRTRTVLFVIFMSLFMVGVAGAMQGDPTPTPTPEPEVVEASTSFNWSNLWQMALAGALGTAFIGAGKKGQFDPRAWDMKKMIQKAVVGVAVGVFASFKGIDLDSAKVAFADGDGLALAALLVFGLDYLFRTVWKGAAISVRKLVDNFKKAGNGNPPTSPPQS